MKQQRRRAQEVGRSELEECMPCAVQQESLPSGCGSFLFGVRPSSEGLPVILPIIGLVCSPSWLRQLPSTSSDDPYQRLWESLLPCFTFFNNRGAVPRVHVILPDADAHAHETLLRSLPPDLQDYCVVVSTSPGMSSVAHELADLANQVAQDSLMPQLIHFARFQDIMDDIFPAFVTLPQMSETVRGSDSSPRSPSQPQGAPTVQPCSNREGMRDSSPAGIEEMGEAQNLEGDHGRRQLKDEPLPGETDQPMGPTEISEPESEEINLITSSDDDD